MKPKLKYRILIALYKWRNDRALNKDLKFKEKIRRRELKERLIAIMAYKENSYVFIPEEDESYFKQLLRDMGARYESEVWLYNGDITIRGRRYEIKF